MKKVFLFLSITGLAACNNTTKVEREVDTLTNKIDTLTKKISDSNVADSIKAKGGRLLDSTKSKGDRLIKGIDEKLKQITIKTDSTK